MWVVVVLDLGLVAMADDGVCDRPIGGTELLFEREFVDVERVARKIVHKNQLIIGDNMFHYKLSIIHLIDTLFCR